MAGPNDGSAGGEQNKTHLQYFCTEYVQGIGAPRVLESCVRTGDTLLEEIVLPSSGWRAAQIPVSISTS